MNNLKRFTVCKLAGHKWLKIGYPAGPTGRGGYLCAVSGVPRRTTTQERSRVEEDHAATAL